MKRCVNVRGVLGRVAVLIAMGGVASAGGCAPMRSDAYTPQTEERRDPAASERIGREAAAEIESDPALAESMLREALGLDLYNGPAHNNLGVLYLKQGKLYEAAGEFEWARKLMPGHPDPRMNLALTLEKAGRLDEALTTYRTALEVYPRHIESMQALSRLQVRTGKRDDATRGMLEEIALRGTSEKWREWARRVMVKGKGMGT